MMDLPAVLGEGIHAPTKATLKKYGLTEMEWWELFHRNLGRCHICDKEFEPGKRINTDHEHVRGWKHMPPEERKKHVRGLLCYTCNRFMVMKGMTSERLYKGWQYVRAWEVRITPESLARQPELRGDVRPKKKIVKRLNVSHTNQQQDEKY